MKHFQLPESNKSMIPLVECIFLSAAMPGLVYIVVWAIQIPNKDAGNAHKPKISKQRSLTTCICVTRKKNKYRQSFGSLPFKPSRKQIF